MIDSLTKFWRARIKPLLVSSKPEPSLPLGLSREQLEQIQALTETVPYKHFVTTLGHLYENNLAAILRGLPHDAYMFQCGVCFALEQIAKLPADLTAKAEELNARHTARSPDTTADASAAFVNTPFWDTYQRLGKRTPKYGGAGIPISHE